MTSYVIFLILLVLAIALPLVWLIGPLWTAGLCVSGMIVAFVFWQDER